jgi:tetratricopeptide (TPR) repeat protein
MVELNVRIERLEPMRIASVQAIGESLEPEAWQKLRARVEPGGYDLLEHGRIGEAIDVFKFNVSEYPESANAFDGLSKAYMTSGDKELAIHNYKRSLELDPKNQNSLEMLKRLK